MTRSDSGDEKGSGPGLLRTLLRGLLSPGENLTGRIVHGGIWVTIQKVAIRGVNFVKMVVLARLLAPEDFGLFGIALLTQTTLDALLNFGIDQALIHEKDRAEEYLDTAWTFNVLKAVAVAALLLVGAPYVAAFFDAPSATPLIRVLSGVVIVQGLGNVGVVYFQKDLEFSKQFSLNFTANLIGAVTAISLALALGSVWALMAGIAASAVAKMVLSYVLHPYRPSLEMDKGKVSGLWGYGKWLFGSSTLVYASTQGDDVLLGRWLGASALGIYQVAYQISNAVATEVSSVISSVTFPAYAKLQSQPDRLRSGFLETLAVTALVVVPLTGAIWIFMPDFVRHVIGEKWSEAIGPVRILSIAGLIRAFAGCWGPLYMAVGITKDTFWKQLLRASLVLGPAYPLTMQFGIEGMSMCVVLGICGSMGYNVWLSETGKLLKIHAAEVVGSIYPAVLATVTSTVATLVLRPSVTASLTSFVVFAALYCFVYLAVVATMELLGQETGVRQVARLLGRA